MLAHWTTLHNSQLIENGILEIGDGYRAKNSELSTNGLPFARAGNIDNGFHFEEADILDDSSVRKAGSKISQPNDIVFTSKGTVGRFAFVKPETPRFVYSPQLCYWRIRKPSIIDPRFLFYWMHGRDFHHQVHQVKSLTTMADYVSLSDQRKMKIAAPPLTIQHTIAGILSAYDDLIENNARRIAILEEMARMLYDEWFVKFRFPGHEEVKMVESEMGMIPEGWEPSPLGALASEVRRGVNPEVIDPETPYFGLEHLPRRSIALSEWGIAREVQSTKLSFQKDEILFGKIRPYLHKVGVAPLNGVCSSDTIVISIKQKKYFGFVLCCVSSDNFVDHANKTSQGTHMPRANWDILVKYPLALPPESLLALFNETIRSFVTAIHNWIFRNRNLRRTRDLLLPKLISGEIDVSSWIENEVGEQEVTVASELGMIREMEPAKPIDVAAMQQRLLWE